MGSLSIRGVDEELAALLKQKAAAGRKSVNQFILDTLRKYVGLEKDKKFTVEYDDLDDLFGRWPEEEYRRVQDRIEAGRGIDDELWK